MITAEEARSLAETVSSNKEWQDHISKAITQVAVMQMTEAGFYVDEILTDSEVEEIKNRGFSISEPRPTDPHIGYYYSITW